MHLQKTFKPTFLLPLFVVMVILFLVGGSSVYAFGDNSGVWGDGQIPTDDSQPRALCPTVSGTGVDFEKSLGLDKFNFLGVWKPDNPISLFIWFFYAMMGLTTALAVTVIVMGGIRYVAGAGNASQQTKAKEWIWNAIIGLILAVSSILILGTINSGLTNIVEPNLPVGDEDGTPLQQQLALKKAESKAYCECLKNAEGDTTACQSGWPTPPKGAIKCGDASIDGCRGNFLGDNCVKREWIGGGSGECTLTETDDNILNYCTCPVQSWW